MIPLELRNFIEQVRLRMDLDIDDPVNPYDHLFEDIGLDSFRYFELIAIVEAMAGCSVAPIDNVELATLADAFEYYQLCCAS